MNKLNKKQENIKWLVSIPIAIIASLITSYFINHTNNLAGLTNINNAVQLNNQRVKEITKADNNEQEKTTVIKKEEINQPPINDNKNSTSAIEKEIKSESAAVPEILDQQKSIEQKIENNHDNQTQYYKVTKVVDGDTVAADIDGVSETIRMIGINTPETKDPRKPVECFGIEASKKAEELLAGQLVELEKDETQDERDKYGRLLRYVKIKNGLFYNLEIIKQGYGYEYTYNIPCKYQKEFKEAENYARENKLGLWADGACGMGNIDNDANVSDSTPAQSVIPAPQSTECECSSNKYNCVDFKTHAEAQAIYDCCGGASNDIHNLDNDKDGEACESLP